MYCGMFNCQMPVFITLFSKFFYMCARVSIPVVGMLCNVPYTVLMHCSVSEVACMLGSVSQMVLILCSVLWWY